MRLWASAVLLLVLAPVGLAGPFSSGMTTRVSVSSAGEEGDGRSEHAAVSGDGRFVAFESEATNLVPGDTNGVRDVFVHDAATGETTRVSIATGGGEGNGPSYQPSISADGRFVSFLSAASNIDVADADANPDVYVHDRLTGETSVIPFDNPRPDLGGLQQSLSPDGGFLAFHVSRGPVRLLDRASGEMATVSRNAAGKAVDAPDHSFSPPVVSSLGKFVAFATGAALVLEDADPFEDVYLYDVENGVTELVSLLQVVPSFGARLSDDGRFIAYQSFSEPQIDPLDVTWLDRETGDVRTLPRASQGYSDIALSGDGRFVSFTSPGFILTATLLVPGLYLWEPASGDLEIVSVDPAGAPVLTFNMNSDLSFDGRFVAFDSSESTFVLGDTNGQNDVFLRDREGPCQIGCLPLPP